MQGASIRSLSQRMMWNESLVAVWGKKHLIMKARQAFADGLRHKFRSGSEELTYLHNSTTLDTLASWCMMALSMAKHWPHELTNLQVEPPQVNGHVVELLPRPCVVVRPKVRSEPLCIPAAGFSKKSCSHLHRKAAQAPWFPPTTVCNVMQPLLSPVPLCNPGIRHCHASRSQRSCPPAADQQAALSCPALSAAQQALHLYSYSHQLSSSFSRWLT